MTVLVGPQQAANAGGADSAFAAAHAELRADQSLQFQMDALTPQPPPQWLEPLFRFLEAIAPFLVYVFWAGVAIVVALILYVIVSEIMRRMPGRKEKVAPEQQATPAYRPAYARAKALLEEADRLAAQGRYSEAARVLLHRSIEDLEQVFSLAIGPGLTSREIARLDPLSPQGRDVFSGIARAVEMSLFGGRALGASDFAQCREAYASFALQGSRR
jgi:hypothetical protein